MDQGGNTHQKRTRQIDEPRRGVLPTSTYLTVCRIDTQWTVIPKKAAAIADMSEIYIKIKTVY